MKIQRVVMVLFMACNLVGGTVTDGIAFRLPWIDVNNNISQYLPTEPPPILHWDLRQFPDCRIPYTINANCPDLANEATLIVAAATTWSAVQPSVTTLFRQPATTVKAVIAQDNENILYWEANPNGLWLGEAYHHPWPWPATGIIEESDIRFNDKYYIWGDDAAPGFNHQLAVGGGAGPFDMTGVLAGAGPHLTVNLDGGDLRNVTFEGGDFLDNGAATRQEIVNAINNDILGATAAYIPFCMIATALEGNVLLLKSNAVHPGGGNVRTIEVAGPARPVLGFPAGIQTVSNVDVQTLALHELGHFMGLADLYSGTTQFGSAEVMYGHPPQLSAKRALHNDDRDGINFLHTPDHGDAPDSKNPQGFAAGKYPSYVHSTYQPYTPTLNGVQLYAPAEGAEHIFGYYPDYQYEWLGNAIDDHPLECEARVTDLDLFDDGVSIAGNLAPGGNYQITINVRINNQGNHDGDRYLNAWIDWDGNDNWEAANKIIGTNSNGSCDPGGTQQFNASEVKVYNCTVPATVGSVFDYDGLPLSTDVWARFRLDYEEDVSHVAKLWTDGTLNEDKGAAQFGEVEDYPITIYPEVPTECPVVFTECPEITIEPVDVYANCGDVGVKIPLCLCNQEDPVGGFQMDLCESIDDCLECTECELTERTQLFDCVVNELDNGCCRVILFSKSPGGLINPGECDIVIIVYRIKDEPQCCDNCIEIDGENIVVVDEYGYQLTAAGFPGKICLWECGDVEPGESAPGAGDCGDGDVDIFDVLKEVVFALGTSTPDSCQGPPPSYGPRDDVPTGTPPNCLDPDGKIDILDIMVLIDMALNRQDCCSYYYGGSIY